MPHNIFGDDVTITMPLGAAANTAVQIKSRLHDLQDLIDDGYSVGHDVFECYLVALVAVNRTLPEDFKQHWTRS